MLTRHPHPHPTHTPTPHPTPTQHKNWDDCLQTNDSLRKRNRKLAEITDTVQCKLLSQLVLLTKDRRKINLFFNVNLLVHQFALHLEDIGPLDTFNSSIRRNFFRWATSINTIYQASVPKHNYYLFQQRNSHTDTRYHWTVIVRSPFYHSSIDRQTLVKLPHFIQSQLVVVVSLIYCM